MNGNYAPLLAIAGFAVLWTTIVFLISHLGGWASLAERYRCDESFTGERWRFQRGQFRWLAGYNNCLTIGADPRGLYLSVFPLFRMGHPPLFIPWRDISVSRTKVFWVKQLRFSLGNDPCIPLTVYERLGQRIQAAAASSWTADLPAAQ
jgi:hypothetical protein